MSSSGIGVIRRLRRVLSPPRQAAEYCRICSGLLIRSSRLANQSSWSSPRAVDWFLPEPRPTHAWAPQGVPVRPQVASAADTCLAPSRDTCPLGSCGQRAPPRVVGFLPLLLAGRPVILPILLYIAPAFPPVMSSRSGDLLQSQGPDTGDWDPLVRTHRGRLRVETRLDDLGVPAGSTLVLRLKPTKTDPTGIPKRFYCVLPTVLSESFNRRKGVRGLLPCRPRPRLPLCRGSCPRHVAGRPPRWLC